jgi:hypothetical protein
MSTFDKGLIEIKNQRGKIHIWQLLL